MKIGFTLKNKILEELLDVLMKEYNNEQLDDQNFRSLIVSKLIDTTTEGYRVVQYIYKTVSGFTYTITIQPNSNTVWFEGARNSFKDGCGWCTISPITISDKFEIEWELTIYGFKISLLELDHYQSSIQRALII